MSSQYRRTIWSVPEAVARYMSRTDWYHATECELDFHVTRNLRGN